jgi:hypothetical protein
VLIGPRVATRYSVRWWLLSALMAAAPVAGQTSPPTYSIAAIEYLPTPLEKVGKVQAGLLCLPKGKLRWRDVAQPEDEKLLARLTGVLGDGGLSVPKRADRLFADPEPQTTYRLKIVVETVKLRLCVAGLGIGEMQPKGEGRMTVRWETYDRVARAKVATVSFDVPIVLEQRDPRGATGVLGDALAETALRYAAARKGAD